MHADLSNPAQSTHGLTAVPLFHAAWLFAAGIVVASRIWLHPSHLLIPLALVAALCCVAALRAQRVVWLPLAVLWLMLGAWCGEMEPQPAPAPALVALSDGLLRNVEGTVVDAGPVRTELEQNVDEPSATAPSQRIDVRVATVEVVTDESDAQAQVTGGVRLTVRWPVDAQGGARAFRCGERVRAVVRLLPPETYRDPGVWSRADYLLGQGITSTATVAMDRVERLGQAPGAFLSCRVSGWQHLTTTKLLALPAAMRNLPAPLRLSEDDAIMLAAMVAGDRTYLTHALRVGFERTGSFHMLVVSGFHLAIVAACIFWITRRLRLPRVPATILTIAASFAYALFTGFATPVQRSLWMVTLYLLGRLVYRERNPLNTIGFASLCLLVVSPRSLFDASLQMTLLAVIAIAGVAAPLLQGTIHPYAAATRDLRLVAVDIKLAPKLAEFRVSMRMVAERLQAVIHPGFPAPKDLDPHVDGAKMEPPIALLRDTLRMFVAETKAAFHGRLAESIAWRVFPWTVRFAIRVVELFVVSCVVELAMALPMAVYFHRITIFALPVNILIVPLLIVLMPAALFTLLMLIVWPAAAVVPAMAVALVMHIGVGLVHLFGSMALGDFRIPGPLLWQSAAFCALLGAAIVLAHESLRHGESGCSNTSERAAKHPQGLKPSLFRRLIGTAKAVPFQNVDSAFSGERAGRWLRRGASVALVLAALAAVMPRPVERPKGAMLMEAIDVGQGDSLLIITPDGKTLLVDGGGFGGGPRQAPQDFDIGEEVVSPALWARGIRHLDAVALSHAHSDHMGGLPAVLRNFHPDELWVGNNPRFKEYNALLDEAAALHVWVRSFRAGDTFTFGSTQVNVLAPFRDYQPGAEPANNDSLVLHVAYGATSVMLEGDAEAPVEQAMLSEPDLKSTLLKVGHHGSITSTRPEFFARVAPQWAVISCGLHNRYGHPREEVLEELQEAHVRTFRTDINGVSCFVLDGKTASGTVGCGGR
ncbi:MAG: ComEC/Rec2 family competence protein [Terracidiphilus sp.]|jgi:competence protein ComEC